MQSLHRALRAFSILALTLCSVLPRAATALTDPVSNKQCEVGPPNKLLCSLIVGVTSYRLFSASDQYLELVNASGGPLQINWVQGHAATLKTGFLEYCVMRDEASTGQTVSGLGEIGCATRQRDFQLDQIRWASGADGKPGLLLAAGDRLIVGSNPYKSEAYFDVEVSSSVATKDTSQVWRQPRLDESIGCNGTVQSTKVAFWKNTTGKRLLVGGALIYAVSADPLDAKAVKQACVVARNARGAETFRDCRGFEREGFHALSGVVVETGGEIGAYAHNTCRSGLWDWAAYLTIKN